MHSENLEIHERSMVLYEEILDETAEKDRHHGEQYLNAAKLHRDIILEFGRYPHRNAILGRESSERENEYLIDAEKFGQG